MTWLVTRCIMLRLREITTTVALGWVVWTVVKALSTRTWVVMLTVSTGLLVSTIPGLPTMVWVTVICRVRLLDRLTGHWLRKLVGLRLVTARVEVICLVTVVDLRLCCRRASGLVIDSVICYCGLSEENGPRNIRLDLWCRVCFFGDSWFGVMDRFLQLMSLVLVGLRFSTTWANADPLELELLTMVRYLLVRMLMETLKRIRRCVVCGLKDPVTERVERSGISSPST